MNNRKKPRLRWYFVKFGQAMEFCPSFPPNDTDSLTEKEQLVAVIMYTTATSMGALLNLAVITIVSRFREVQTAIHLIILNLSVAGG